MSKIAKEKLVKEKALKVKGAPRLRIPGGGRRIKEIEDPAVAKKLSRFSSAAPSKIVEEGTPNHLSSSAARKSTEDEQDAKTLSTKPSRFSSSRKSSRRPHIRKKIKDTASGEEDVASGPEEKSSKPHLREKSFRRTSTVGGRMRKPITTDGSSVNGENTNKESVLEEKSSKSFRRKSSVGGRMRKPVGASVSSEGGEEAAEPHRPVSRTRGRARVRGDEEKQDVDKISSEQIDTSEESTEREEKEDKGTSRGRVRAPPSLASVVRHR